MRDIEAIVITHLYNHVILNIYFIQKTAEETPDEEEDNNNNNYGVDFGKKKRSI